MNDDDAMRGFVQAIQRSAYRPRSRRPEPESPPVDRLDYLRRMLHDAFNPARPEDNWRDRFATRTDLTAELFDRTEEQSP